MHAAEAIVTSPRRNDVGTPPLDRSRMGTDLRAWAQANRIDYEAGEFTWRWPDHQSVRYGSRFDGATGQVFAWRSRRMIQPELIG